MTAEPAPLTDRPRAERFSYEGVSIDRHQGLVHCTYNTDGHSFTETFWFGPDGDWSNPAVEQAVRLLFLLAAVSYYKTTAATVIDLGQTPTTKGERAFLLRYFQSGLAEFAFRNGIDLGDLRLEHAASVSAPQPVRYRPRSSSPLIPFGGGIDSIVTVESLTRSHPAASLCIVHPPGDRFAAIEDAAAVTDLSVVRIGRQIDPAVRQSTERGFFNGHVPITAVITATALAAAVVHGHDAVVLSNEWSASVPTVLDHGRPVNHQWSKSDEFEAGFARLVDRALGPEVAVFSYLRPRSELWVAREFAGMTRFHHAFRSCNRAFHQDPAQRLDHWCGHCDKCCFIDLILSPFMSAPDLAQVFAGAEPLDSSDNAGRLAALIGEGRESKPFECVGDITECRAAVVLAHDRSDRADNTVLRQLREQVAVTDVEPLLQPMGPHYIPERYAPRDLLARTR